MIIDLGEFAPDRSQFDPSATDMLVNFVPRQGAWGPFPSFGVLSAPLPADPCGAFLANLSQGDFQLFAATRTRLYKLNPTTLGWDDVSKQVSGSPVNYATPDERLWSFTQYGSLILATNGVDPIQSYDTASPSYFSDLSSAAPTAVNLNVVGDFVFATNTSDGERAARWSGLNNPIVWTPGEQSSDLQLFPDGGEIQAVAAFERGALIFQEDCVREAQLALNTPLIMTFSKTIENHGVLARKSVVSTGVGVFYLSQDGFYRYGAPPTSIGAERVNNFFFQNVATDQVSNVVGSEDPYRSVVYWSYLSNGSNESRGFDSILCYHYALDRWTFIDPGLFLSGMIEAVTPGYTLDSIDDLGYNLDTLPFSLDSRVLAGGAPTLAGFDAQRRLGFFNGDPLQAQGRTAKLAMSEGRRTYVSGFRPITDAPAIQGRVGQSAMAAEPVSWGSFASMNRTGLVPSRSDGRFHQIEIQIPAGGDWTTFNGIEPEAQLAGRQ